MLQLAIVVISAGILISFVALFGLSTGLPIGVLGVLAFGFALGLTGILLGRAWGGPAATQRRLRQA
ncbi:MAG TPA: hypothetical protein VGH28_10870 [Polyangiaceae bacterium]|jgi:hypothetical protein